MKKYIVAPSILTADFLNLDIELKKLWDVGIRWIHYDVMDYNFVPNLTFGPKILSDIVKKYDFKIDIHLMVIINNMTVSNYLSPFISKKVNQITMHVEALTNVQIAEFITYCKHLKIKSSLALSPNTDIEALKKYLPELDNILIMSVQPGAGGQKYLPQVETKIKELINIRNQNKFSYTIAIDGGINEETYNIVQKLGIDMLVAGSYLINQPLHILEERVKKLEG